MTKENKKSKTDNKQKCYDTSGIEINDPYDVIASRLREKVLELRGSLGSLENPGKLLEVYDTGRDLATLTSTLLEIYELPLKELGLPDVLDRIEKTNEMYRNELVKKLSGNKGIYFTKKAYERSRKFLSECYDFTKKKRKRT